MVFSDGQFALGAGQGGEYSASDVEFHDEPGKLFRLAFANSALTLLTLGLYRFWGQAKSTFPALESRFWISWKGTRRSWPHDGMGAIGATIGVSRDSSGERETSSYP